MHNPESFLENEMLKILCNFEMLNSGLHCSGCLQGTTKGKLKEINT